MKTYLVPSLWILNLIILASVFYFGTQSVIGFTTEGADASIAIIHGGVAVLGTLTALVISLWADEINSW